MLSINERISLRQLQALIVISAMGTGIIVLPRRVAEIAGSDGWIIVIGLVLVATIIGALVATAARLRPGDSFLTSTGFFLSKPVAYVIGVVFWLKLIVAAGLELRVFMLVVQEVLLKNTPIVVTGIIMLAVAGYAAIKGIETRARVAEVLLCLMVLPFIFLVVVALFDLDLSNLQPVLVTPPETLLKGTLRLGFIFTGLECVLLVSPYISPKKKMRRAVVTALAFAGLLIIVVSVITLAKFGRGVVDLPWPVLSMMDMLNLPGAFIERQEALMFSFWIITNFAILNGLLFFGGVLFKDFLRKKDKPLERPHGPSRANRPWQIGILVTAAAVFIITCIPWDEAAIYERMDIMYYTLGVFYLVVLPVILILVSKIKKAAKPAILITLGLVSLVSLAACWDKVEIENRAFVVAVSIDKTEESEYTVTLSLPATDKDDEENDEPSFIKSATAETITEAIKKIDSQTDTPLYFGHTKMLVLGESLLSEHDMMRSTLYLFNDHREIDRAMYLLAAHGDGADILKTTPPGDDLPGRYVAAIYRDKHKIGGSSFIMSLDDVVTQMKFDEAVLMPTLTGEKGNLTLSGAALVFDYAKIDQLTSDDVQGYLWTIDSGNLGAIVTANVSNQPVPYKVEKHSAYVRFKENNTNLEAHILVELTGRIEECPQIDENTYQIQIANMIEQSVKKEILATAARMQNEFGLDGYHWLETLRKKQYSLYQIYNQDWHEVFINLEIIPHVAVRIKN